MRRRTLPPTEELLAQLAEAGATDAPTTAPDPTMLQGLLDMAAYVAEHRKQVAFPDFHWDDPGFVSTDAKVRFRFAYTTLPGATADAVKWCLEGNLDRILDGRTLLAIDARTSGIREFELNHHLFGEVTLFSFPHRPLESADPRIDTAREAGWTRVLKEHNLIPGRGMVVLDEHQGILLRDDRLRDLVGLLILYETGNIELVWNPFVRPDANDPEFQYWLSWGPGSAPSEWRRVFEARENE